MTVSELCRRFCFLDLNVFTFLTMLTATHDFPDNSFYHFILLLHLLAFSMFMSIVCVYLALVQSVLLYASETWTLTVADSKSLDAFHMKC